MEDPWIDYGWICTRCTRETNAKLGEEGHVRGNVRGWLERERERAREEQRAGKGLEVNLPGAVCTSIQNHAAWLVNGIISDTREHGIRCCPGSPSPFVPGFPNLLLSSLLLPLPNHVVVSPITHPSLSSMETIPPW